MRFFVDFLYALFACLRASLLKFVPKRFRHKSIAAQNVVITGAGSGLGRALAIRFAKCNANIALLDIDERGVRLTEKLLQKQFKGFIKSYVCDVTDRNVVHKTAEVVNRDMGFVSVLVNNAGVLHGKSILELTDDNIIQTFNVNTLSNFWTIREFLPPMMAENRGHIVTIASICGKLPFVRMTDYCASKHAVMGLNESLRLELAMRPNNRIVTTAILPTFFRTELIMGATPTKFLRFQDLDYVANATMDAILTDEAMVLIPGYLNPLVMLWNTLSLVSTDLLIKIFQMLGGFRVMSEFRGKRHH